MKRLAVVLALLVGAQAAPAADPARKGIDYLLQSQNPDGSWGSLKESTPEAGFWWVPESHRAWRVATTGLCCMALMERSAGLPEAKGTVLHGIDYILANARLQRPSSWDTDHLWGRIYALEALSRAEAHPWAASRKGRIRPAVDALIRDLASEQTPSGGWAYYDDFDAPATSPPKWATSFTTANAILALRAARESGHVVPPVMMDAAKRALERARLPDGAYAYHASAGVLPPRPGRDSLNNVKGSLARIQVGNLALGKDLAKGLDLFFAHHRFLDAACYRPVPHEAYYQNSGYFYLYGHAYAGRAIRSLPKVEQAKYRSRLDREVLKMQSPDGSWWDFPMQGYAKPYGTAFALMALLP